MPTAPVYGRIEGAIVMIGFGSIGRGTLPLIERHFEFDKEHFVVIGPDDSDRALLDERGIKFVQLAITRDNYREVLGAYLKAGKGQGFCVNLSVDTSSLDLMRFCREIGALYIDTVVEPWPGFYYDKSRGNDARTNYALRETVLAERRANPGGTTAVSCCGANPGMVSWFVKQALVNLARDSGDAAPEPNSREDWGKLAQRLGVKGVHIAERDTQRAKHPKPMNTFVNTWSIEGFLSEGMQPAELGWGTHEKWTPANAGFHKAGCGAAIYLLQPGANTRVRSWTPTPQRAVRFPRHPQRGDLHRGLFHGARRQGRASSPIARRATTPIIPADDAVLSLHEIVRAKRRHACRRTHHILTENEIVDGVDELGVLLYGHKPTTRTGMARSSPSKRPAELAPYQNATGMQVTSAVLAGMVWALENPKRGVVEADEMDYKRDALKFSRPYSGPDRRRLYGLERRSPAGQGLFPEDVDLSDPWQFRNVLVR